MYGRFTLTVSAEELKQLFYIENLGKFLLFPIQYCFRTNDLCCYSLRR